MLAAKVAAAAIIVVAASRATERAGPVLGAMIATLPVSADPVYVFLALDHGAAFVSEAARTSVASTAATAGFVAVHAFAAQRFARERRRCTAARAGGGGRMEHHIDAAQPQVEFAPSSRGVCNA